MFMASKTKITCKVCRREGVSLCGKDRCALKRRHFPPGVHGPQQAKKRPHLSGYGTQLREKQKAKRLYGILEKQFVRYVEEALRKKGNTSECLVQLLESRLDNVVYRLGLGKTRRQARQMVSHGFIAVNGQKLNVPSCRIKVGDEITLKDSKKQKGVAKQNLEGIQKHETPKWLSFDATSMIGKMTAIPEGEDLRQLFDPTLIVEFYSR